MARSQHGVVSRAQLARIGLAGRSIDHRVSQGRLHVIHRGVYAVGHDALTQRSRWMAAVLAGGDGIVLGYRDAGAHWRVRPSSRRLIEVTGRRGRRPGIQFHEAVLAPDEVTVHEGIPVTTVARTLFDLASVVDARQVERAINEADVLRLWDQLSLAALLKRYPSHAGTRGVREALAWRAEGPTPTRNDFEERFLAIVRAAALPNPEVNVMVEAAGRSFEIDFLWRERRLAVELDSRTVHGTLKGFESDRAKDRALSIAGWRPVRYTWRQLDRVGGELPLLLGTV